MKYLVTIFLFLLTVQGMTHAEDSMQTRFGLVETARSAPNAMYIDTITVNEKLVYKVEDIFVSLKNTFELGDKDVVLFGTNCGGNSCPFDELHFLILQKGRKPKVVNHSDFISSDGTEKPKQVKDAIVVDLGYDAGRRKKATFDGEKIAIEFEAPGKKAAMKNKDCKWVYDNTVDGQCILEREEDKTCGKLDMNYFPGAVRRGVAAISNSPGFNHDALEKLCLAACKSGKAEKYAVFKRSVCGIK
ncbi:MAG: hypothetical protein HZB31_08710 [Nitrospirae bacterium]|nr:hypothetical protein [Nitrospirota bacterium]